MTDAIKKNHSEGLDGQTAKMPFTEHLKELRKRLIICIVAVAVGFGICYYFSQPIFQILMRPLINVLPPGDKLIYTGLPEAFFTYMKVGFWGGLVLAVPVMFHQLWMFVAPGLYRNEKRYVIPFVILTTVMFLVGGLFCYFVVFPFGFQYFLGFTDETIKALPAMKEYFSLSLKMLFGFGIIFELPLGMVFMGKMGLVNARMLSKGRKYAILLIFVVAAVLTPPDVVSQTLMAFPLWALYEISIVLVRLIGKQKEAKAAEKEHEEEV